MYEILCLGSLSALVGCLSGNAVSYFKFVTRTGMITSDERSSNTLSFSFRSELIFII